LLCRLFSTALKASSTSEATSAIDVPAERKIIDAMLDLKPRPTIVMIAHRDQSLAFCDRRLRLQNGKAMADEPALAV